jgi:hypothetical protein
MNIRLDIRCAESWPEIIARMPLFERDFIAVVSSAGLSLAA